MGKGKAKEPKEPKEPKTESAKPVEEELRSDPVRFLVAPETTSAFFTKNWEKQPAVFKATPDRKRWLHGVLSYDDFSETVTRLNADGNVLGFGVDVNVVRYVDQVRETCNGDGVADIEALESLYEDGCTLQVHQPQRYVDKLWELCAALERELGCLVGCNAYITPDGKQGLAPHHDDVELWVCQTAGSKRWRVYAPLDGYELPSVSSGDIPRAELGDPLLDVTLEVGDVLYLPRGAVHEAVAEAGESAHVTISTYQKHTWGDLLERVLPLAKSLEGEDAVYPLSLRQGLPVGFVYQHGHQRMLLIDKEDKDLVVTVDDGYQVPKDAADAAKRLAQGLRDLAQAIEDNPQLVISATDDIGEEFARSRLPPPPSQLPPAGPEPTLDSHICCRGKGLFRLALAQRDDEDSDDDDVEGDDEDEEEEEYYEVLNCLNNERHGHMMDFDDDGDDDDEDEDDDEDGAVMAPEDDEAEEEDDDDAPELVEIQPEMEGMIGEESDSMVPDLEERKKLIRALLKGTAAGGDDDEDDDEDEDGAGADEGIEIGDSDDDDDEDDDEDDDNSFLVPLEHIAAVAQILACTGGRTVRVKDLPTDDDVKLPLVLALHEAGVVQTVEKPAQTAVKKAKKRKEPVSEPAADEAPRKKHAGPGAAAAGKPASKDAPKAPGKKGNGRKSELSPAAAQKTDLAEGRSAPKPAAGQVGTAGAPPGSRKAKGQAKEAGGKQAAAKKEASTDAAGKPGKGKKGKKK